MSLPREVLKKYMTGPCLFIETGTKWGDTAIRAAEFGADRVISFEADEAMAKTAMCHVKDAAPWAEIKVEYGDSVKGLAGLGREVADTRKRVVVFLDAHTESKSPVEEELSEIFKWGYLPDVVLIDDLGLMLGWGVNPDHLESSLERHGYVLSYENGSVAVNDILVGVRK